MIISVEKLKTYVTTNLDDSVLEEKLQALESLVRTYTNNNFQNRKIRFRCNVKSAGLDLLTQYLSVGDTIQISQSAFNDGVYDIIDIQMGVIALNKPLFDEDGVLITKVEYPYDVRLGVVNMMKWDITNRDKVGIQSETISRHSVSYFNMDGDNSLMGYPKSLLGFLEPYKRARF